MTADSFLSHRSRTWKRLAKAWRTQAAYVHEKDTMGARLRNWFLYKAALKYLQGVAVALDVKGNDPQAIVDAAVSIRRERDLAVAHDRQPYPTADAYEKACAALEKHRARAEKLKELVERYRPRHSTKCHVKRFYDDTAEFRCVCRADEKNAEIDAALNEIA